MFYWNAINNLMVVFGGYHSANKAISAKMTI
jgi:hypothetical protein